MNYAEINMSVYYTLLPVAVFCGFFISALVVFSGRVVVYGMPRTERIDDRDKSIFINRFLMEYWYWLIKPVERTIVRVHLSPDVVTISGTVLAACAGVAFAFGYFTLGGWLVIFGGTLDMLDGAVARAMHMTSKAGSFLDSTLDRYSELLSLAGLVYYYSSSPFVAMVFLAVIGSTMVSYARAKAESVGVDAKMGNMQRAERVLYIGLGAALSPVVANIFEPNAVKPIFHLSVIAISIVAIFSNITALRRLVHAYTTLKKADREAKENGNQ